MCINEVKEAEKIIKTNRYEKISVAVGLLIRYYFHKQNLTPDEIREKIKAFVTLHHEDYDHWESFVNKTLENVENVPLCEIDEIPITQKEIDVIKSVENKKEQKILFAFLVMGKLKYLKTGKSWVNNTGATFFKNANVDVRTEERDYIIKKFHDAGFLSYAKSPMNMAIHIDFIDKEKSNPVLMIKDLRELGFRWLLYIGERYVECNQCGILFRPNSSNDRYCKKHRGYIPLKTKIIECRDCGVSFETSAGLLDKRCPNCKRLHYNKRLKEYMRKKANLTR